MTIPYRGIIFDMDGLMIDSEALSFRCWEQAGRENGYVITRETFSKVVGFNSDESAKIWRNALGEDFPVERLRKRRTELFDREVVEKGIATMPGLLELLDFLEAKKIPKAVGTSTKDPAATARLERADVKDRFDGFITGDMVDQCKPAPDIYLKACQILGFEPSECLALEDSDTGAYSAIAAGCTVILVPNMKAPSGEILSKVQRVCSSLHEVQKYLEVLT